MTLLEVLTFYCVNELNRNKITLLVFLFLKFSFLLLGNSRVRKAGMFKTPRWTVCHKQCGEFQRQTEWLSSNLECSYLFFCTWFYTVLACEQPPFSGYRAKTKRKKRHSEHLWEHIHRLTFSWLRPSYDVLCALRLPGDFFTDLCWFTVCPTCCVLMGFLCQMTKKPRLNCTS